MSLPSQMCRQSTMLVDGVKQKAWENVTPLAIRHTRLWSVLLCLVPFFRWVICRLRLFSSWRLRGTRKRGNKRLRCCEEGHRAPILLSIRTRKVLYICFSHRDGSGRHRVISHPLATGRHWLGLSCKSRILIGLSGGFQ